jgi:nickel/cobalt transporter (NicO) family protein
MSRRALPLIVAALLVLAVSQAGFAQNPLRPGGASDQPQLYDGPVPRFIVEWSRTLQQAIASLSRRVLDGEWTAALAAFGLSVVFGAVHIAGPGHGKVFAVSYFGARDARPRDGLVYSAIVNAVDSLSAFLLVMVAYVALRAVLPQARDQAPRILQLVSYGLIVVFGVAHLVSHLGGAHSHADSHAHETQVVGRTGGRKPPWLLAVSVGLVPCPVSTILLVYGVANGVVTLMVLTVVGVSIGGFLTMSLISIAVITGRSSLLYAMQAPGAARVATILEYAASAVIIAAGVILLLSVI